MWGDACCLAERGSKTARPVNTYLVTLFAHPILEAAPVLKYYRVAKYLNATRSATGPAGPVPSKTKLPVNKPNYAELEWYWTDLGVQHTDPVWQAQPANSKEDLLEEILGQPGYEERTMETEIKTNYPMRWCTQAECLDTLASLGQLNEMQNSYYIAAPEVLRDTMKTLGYLDTRLEYTTWCGVGYGGDWCKTDPVEAELFGDQP